MDAVRLDGIGVTGERILVKLDLQGAEAEALEGMGSLWPRCAAVLLEVSYGPSGSYEALRALLAARGFEEAATLNELEEAGLPLEADKLFVRRAGMIGLSLLTLVPGASGAGIERYARDLCRGLGRYGSRAYVGLPPDRRAGRGRRNTRRVISAYPASRSLAGRAFAMARTVGRPGVWCGRCLGGGVKALHYPLTVMVPPVTGSPAAVTITDVQHEVYPEFFSAPERLYRKWIYARTAKRARVVITLSRFSAGIP